MSNKYFNEKGTTNNNILHLTPREAFEKSQNGAIFLDLRRQGEIAYKGFDVPEVIYSSPSEVKENIDKIPHDKSIIVADNAGLRSREIVQFLNSKGFNNIANLIGGMFEWDKNNLPIVLNTKERLSGSCLCMLKPMGKVKRDS